MYTPNNYIKHVRKCKFYIIKLTCLTSFSSSFNKVPLQCKNCKAEPRKIIKTTGTQCFWTYEKGTCQRLKKLKILAYRFFPITKLVN